jgi:hypothetical protein
MTYVQSDKNAGAISSGVRFRRAAVLRQGNFERLSCESTSGRELLVMERGKPVAKSVPILKAEGGSAQLRVLVRAGLVHQHGFVFSISSFGKRLVGKALPFFRGLKSACLLLLQLQGSLPTTYNAPTLLN